MKYADWMILGLWLMIVGLLVFESWKSEERIRELEKTVIDSLPSQASTDSMPKAIFENVTFENAIGMWNDSAWRECKHRYPAKEKDGG